MAFIFSFLAVVFGILSLMDFMISVEGISESDASLEAGYGFFKLCVKGKSASGTTDVDTCDKTKS